MPLRKSSSRAALSANIAAEINAGRPRDQAIAIAESVKRRAAKKAGKQLKGLREAERSR